MLRSVSSALIHPSTKFLLFNNLAPLVSDPSTLSYANHADITTLIGANPFEKSEEVIIKEFRSDVTQPTVLFLGIDEKKHAGFKHGIYEGTPYFAVDVTPKGTVEKAATGIIEEMKKKGLSFLEGRVNMSLAAPDGRSFS
jgi:NAD+ diphosphatase